MKENEKNLRDLQGIMEHTSICVRESQEGRRERKGQKKNIWRPNGQQFLKSAERTLI